MRSVTAGFIVLIFAVGACAIPLMTNTSASIAVSTDPGYVMVGGQNGTWFGPGQAPRLEKVELESDSATPLVPAPTGGTVWGGSWNGSQWLISGWGEDLPTPNGSNPYIFLYNGDKQVVGGSLEQYQAEMTWHGGDIFAASSDGDDWLVSGLGSGNLSASLPSFHGINHMSLALFNGSNFTDLSPMVPDQRDFILYTNAWNGHYWLIGGGYEDSGALYSFDGTKIVDLSSELSDAIPTFGSIQSVAWNGEYWLIGGVNFLASYDGHSFVDLTSRLNAARESDGDCCGSVNAIAWDGAEWVLGGGTPVAQTSPSRAWLVAYDGERFTDFTSNLFRHTSGSSSILSIAAADGSWIIGGYSNGQGLLYESTGGAFQNLSYLVESYTYVNWVGARFFSVSPTSFPGENRIELGRDIGVSSDSVDAVWTRPRVSDLGQSSESI